MPKQKKRKRCAVGICTNYANSIGDLTKPNPCFVEQVKKMETIFLKCYKADLPRSPSIVKKKKNRIKNF